MLSYEDVFCLERVKLCCEWYNCALCTILVVFVLYFLYHKLMVNFSFDF